MFFLILCCGYTILAVVGAAHAIHVSLPMTATIARNALEVTLFSLTYLLWIARPFPSFDGNPGTEWLDRIHW